MVELNLDTFINENGYLVADDIDIIVSFNQKIIYQKGNNKMYDLASLTKVVSSIIVFELVNEKRINLEDEVKKYLPAIQQEIKIYELLCHTSGIRDEVEFDYSNFIKVINQQQLLDKSIQYADYNYILLYLVLEKFGSIDELLKKYFPTLNIVYNPLEKGIKQKNIAPTEIRVNRGLVHGIVHDQKCFSMGGKSAHAGLFCNINDFNTMINKFLLLDMESILKNYQVQNVNEKRTVGFEVNDLKKQMGLFSDKALFHTGFSGTSVLIEPKSNLVITIFTNRIHPTRNNDNIFLFRQKIHNLVYEYIKGEQCVK